MSLVLAVKRSYRYFLPSSLFDLKRLVRRLYIPIFFYIVGWTTGAYRNAEIGSGERITKISIGVLAVLWILRWWAGRYQPGDWFYQTADGEFKQCRE
jgi:hypothetical protein